MTEKNEESDSATETHISPGAQASEQANAGTRETGRIFARISKASFMWSKFDPQIEGVPPITRAGVEFDASHRNSVEEKAGKAGVKLAIEDR